MGKKEMEKRLCDAAVEGDVTTLHQLLGKDPLVLDKAALQCEDKNPLHIAAMLGHVDFVKAILQVHSACIWCLARDRDGRNPLHVAAMYGRLAVLEALLDAGFQAAALEKTDREETILHLCVKYNQLEALKMLVNWLKDREFPNARSGDAAYFLCLARDGNGRNPIHLAAMYGRLAVLQVLLDVGFQAALEKTGEGGTILHLCVKYNQLDALKLLVGMSKDVWFQNAKNEDGMTILHMAIYYRQDQTIKYLLDSSQVWVRRKDAEGRSALLLLMGQANINTEIESFLSLKDAKPGNHDLGEYKVMLRERRDAMMVVLSLIATMAFQAMVSPPGGMWQDDLNEGPNPHRAGEPIMAQTHPTYYRYLIRASTVAFVSSLTAIVLFMRGSGMYRLRAWYLMRLLSYLMGVAIAAVALTYAISLVVLAPKHTRGGQLSNIVVIVLIVVTIFSCSVRPVNKCLLRLGFCINIIQNHVFNLTHRLPRISTNA